MKIKLGFKIVIPNIKCGKQCLILSIVLLRHHGSEKKKSINMV